MLAGSSDVQPTSLKVLNKGILRHALLCRWHYMLSRQSMESGLQADLKLSHKKKPSDRICYNLKHNVAESALSLFTQIKK